MWYCADENKISSYATRQSSVVDCYYCQTATSAYSYAPTATGPVVSYSITQNGDVELLYIVKIASTNNIPVRKNFNEYGVCKSRKYNV